MRAFKTSVCVWGSRAEDEDRMLSGHLALNKDVLSSMS